MSRQFLTSLNLSKNELLNARIQNLATAPGSPVTGQIYFDTTLGALRQFDGAVWKTYTKSGDIVNGDIAANAGIDIAKLGTDVLARANHTGTQPASTISDFDTQVHTSRLDQLAVPTANISLNSRRITNLADPTSAQDAATKQYVDDTVAGLSWKPAVNLLANTDVPLTGATGTVVIDGHAALTQAKTGYRLLLVGQTVTADNGIYVYTDNGSTYALTRSTDADVYTELKGATVFVEEGTTYGTSSWVQSNHYLTSFSGQVWVQFNGASQITAGDGLTKNGNIINAVGTTDRITITSDAIDIASTYVGQTSITTVGTVTSGTWNAGTVDVAHGGTGATTAAGARSNLGATTKYAANNTALTASGGSVTWAVAHNLGTTDVIVQVREIATAALVEVDVVVTNTNAVTLSWISGNVNADLYRVVVIG